MSGKSPLTATDEQRGVPLTLAGWTSARIAAAFSVREDTARLWRSDFASGGIEVLQASVAPGPAPVKSETALRVVAPLLEQPVAAAGDIVLLYGDESEALTHPYLARAWAKAGADLRVPAPRQAKTVAMPGSLDDIRHSHAKRSTGAPSHRRSWRTVRRGCVCDQGAGQKEGFLPLQSVSSYRRIPDFPRMRAGQLSDGRSIRPIPVRYAGAGGSVRSSASREAGMSSSFVTAVVIASAIDG
ncbi:MAG TPA: hypothetical protein VND19_04005 [Acetobacteraceae bacterium]|nr:hypothetical protein [Acetobacteraceae bacterium]